MTIQSFSHRGLRELYDNGDTRRIHRSAHRRLLQLMDLIDGATELGDFEGVSYFHGLGGNRRGTYSFHVTRNWRLTMRCVDGDAIDLDYEDYH